MRIAITGARGVVGGALVRGFPDAVALTHRELDITDRDAVARVLRGVDLVFNCAVIGVDGPANLAEAARSSSASAV